MTEDNFLAEISARGREEKNERDGKVGGWVGG